MGDFFQLLLEVNCFLLGVLTQDIDIVIGSVPLFVGIVGLLDDIGHGFPLVLQFLLQLIIESIEDLPLLPKPLDITLQLLVEGYSLIELLIRLVQPVLQDPDLFLQVHLDLRSTIIPPEVVLLLHYLLLEIGDMCPSEILLLSLLLDLLLDALDLVGLLYLLVLVHLPLLLIQLGLDRQQGTITSFSEEFYFSSFYTVPFCFLMKIMISSV